MKILIGICTRNRNSLLQKNLYSLRKLYIPKFVNLSILVVDNTKNAASNKLIKEFQKKKSFKIKIIYKVVKREGITTSRNQLLKMAKKIIDSKKLGNVINFRCVYGKSKIITFESGDWRAKRKFSGGGILLDQGIHMLDLIRYFYGEFSEFKFLCSV